MPGKKTVITIDPSMQYNRQLHFAERHSGWIVFKAVYWGMYLFVLGIMLLMLVLPAKIGLYSFVGWAVTILSLFIIVYGFSMGLHLKLMKRYA
jgi:uncharacterized membrane protein